MKALPGRARPIGLLPILGAAIAGLAMVLGLVLPDWHLPIRSRQTAASQYAMLQFDVVGRQYPVSGTPPTVQTVPEDTRPATEAYKNVQVLTDVTAAQFLRTQYAITAWVSPKQGCAFCHAGTDYASNAKPEKAAARTMLRMTRHMNADWSSHVAPSGVTCFSCHRGQPMPAEVWFPTPYPPPNGIFEREEQWHEDAQTVRGFFPDAGYSIYALQQTPAHGQSYTALPSNEVPQEIVVKRLYEYMMQMSDGIGVNCGYCHNSRNFADWTESTPARWTGYSGLQMTRDINRNFILAVAATLPQTRDVPGEMRPPLVPLRDTGTRVGNGLALCATCHYGHPKPLDGQDVLRDYPALGRIAATAP